jgi:hypothetical protein
MKSEKELRAELASQEAELKALADKMLQNPPPSAGLNVILWPIAPGLFIALPVVMQPPTGEEPPEWWQDST